MAHDVARQICGMRFPPRLCRMRPNVILLHRSCLAQRLPRLAWQANQRLPAALEDPHASHPQLASLSHPFVLA